MFIKEIGLDIKEPYLSSLQHIFSYFQEKGQELFLVGGCVRDLLLHKEPKDYDLCTNLSPEEVKGLLENKRFVGWFTDSEHNEYPAGVTKYSFIDTGLKHGTITVHDKEANLFFEITTYRVDGKYEDARHPTEVTFTKSLEEDLKRRDFTINALAYDLNTKTIHTLDSSFLSDLDFGIIRCVGAPIDRFSEDALRMLRAIRFAAQMGFSIEKDTYQGIIKKAFNMQFISMERIKDELTKILLSDNPQMLELFALTHLEAYAFVSQYIMSMILCTQHNKYHYTDVFHHTMDVIRRLPKDHDLRWAALFHDIGKPFDKTTDDEGWEHFYNHPEKSVWIAEELMDQLKFSNESKEKILKFVKYHDYPLSKVSDKKFKQKIVEIGEENFLDFLKLREADALAHTLSASTSFAIDAVSICKTRYQNYLAHPEPVRIKDLQINGNDLISLGFEGKSIGDALRAALDHVLEHPEQNTKADLIAFVQTYRG